MSQALRDARRYEEATALSIAPEERPLFHLSARVGWMNDPNGLSRYGGQYHLFYQYHPYDSHWGPMHWGHAVSTDLLHWEYLPAAMAPDMYGQLVPGMEGRMPVVGGVIEVLPFIPDNMIFGGYLDLYLLAEREGTRLEQSEHVHFIQDRTVFKGVARYDGLPVIAEGFVAIGIGGVTPSAASITFAPDTANTPESE